ncbi:MAG: type II CRISPR RNA-guided endonuclease Cas9, partial [Hyphomonadaceae bacterium]
DIDHILPISRTLDDSIANKVVCLRAANRWKRNKSPFEAFGGETPPQIASWTEIEANAARMPRNKSWRFGPKAIEEFSKNGGDFLDRQLNETRYLARMTKTYLSALTPDVWVVNGKLTSLLRGKWGLNRILSGDNAPTANDTPTAETPPARKKRDDHRHHAIDAIVVGCSSRAILNKIARAAGQAEELNLDRLFGNFPEPMPDFHVQVRAKIGSVVVSHKADHGKGGALHEETAYGIVNDELGNLVSRKALDALTVKDAERVRCPNLRARFIAIRDSVDGEQKAFIEALRAWAHEDAAKVQARTGKHRNPIRHVRLLKKEASAMPIADRRSGAAYKAIVPGENYCLDIVSLRDGSWKGFAASRFEVNRKDWRPQWERDKIGGKLVMRLVKGDLVQIDEKDGSRTIKRVVRIGPANQILYLAAHNEAGDLQKRHDDTSDPFRWDFASFSGLKDRKAQRVRVNDIGVVEAARSNIS